MFLYIYIYFHIVLYISIFFYIIYKMCLVERKCFRHFHDASAAKLLHMGSDDRGVRIELDVGPTSIKRRKQYMRRSGTYNVGWRPEAVESYRKALDTCVQDQVGADKYRRTIVDLEKLAYRRSAGLDEIGSVMGPFCL